MTTLTRLYNDHQIRIRSDRYASLTDMARSVGKQLAHWHENKSTKSYLDTLSAVIGIPITDLIQINQGGIPELQGSWGHPKVALRFAQWCSDDFAVQVDCWIDELITTGKVQLAASQPLSAMELLQQQAEMFSQLVQISVKQDERLKQVELEIIALKESQPAKLAPIPKPQTTAKKPGRPRTWISDEPTTHIRMPKSLAKSLMAMAHQVEIMAAELSPID